MTLQTENMEALARVFHTLGDKTRLSIVSLLANGEMNVTSICEKLQIPQSSVSHHLGLLRASELLVARRDGKQIFYSHADLAKHRLAKKAAAANIDRNAGRFGPVDVAFVTKS